MFFWQISLRQRCGRCRIGSPEVSPDVVSVVDEPPLVAAPRRQWRFSDIPGSWYAAYEVVKYLRQHDLAKTPAVVEYLGYLEGARIC